MSDSERVLRQSGPFGFHIRFPFRPDCIGIMGFGGFGLLRVNSAKNLGRLLN